jgi:alkylation response protein AidB-like acyl-CoA dehydrogenase
MPYDLQARTAPGARLVALAETLAEDFATRAGAHDRTGRYPFESIEALKAAGYFAAPVPEEHGGLGVDSVHDLLVASSRLARGDASVAIGVNMHLITLLAIVRRWSIAVAAGNERRTAAFASSMESVVRDGAVMVGATSERNQDLTRPATVATRTETGWRVDGTKVFCTMAPAATVLHTAVTFVDEDGVERYGFAPIPVDAPGVVVNEDWDAMGMRASGSHSITFDGVDLPPSALRGGFRTGEAVPYMERNLVGGLFHASASLGIAESAHGHAIAAIARRGHDLDEARTRMLAAESAIELGATRGAFARAASLIDDHYATNPTSHGTDEELTLLFAEAQAAKTFVNEAAARIVDRALALSGGAGYLNGSPLARAYRDVRAGAFMHPLGANRAYELVGQVELGLEPALH